jgi:hypothetical protein
LLEILVGAAVGIPWIPGFADDLIFHPVFLDEMTGATLVGMAIKLALITVPHGFEMFSRLKVFVQMAALTVIRNDLVVMYGREFVVKRFFHLHWGATAQDGEYNQERESLSNKHKKHFGSAVFRRIAARTEKLTISKASRRCCFYWRQTRIYYLPVENMGFFYT